MGFVIFVHGLGGAPKKTWGRFHRLLKADTTIKQYRPLFYQYPTTLLRWPWTPRLPALSELGLGLKTFIDEEVGGKPFSLICHSLGGIIARQMIVDELSGARQVNISKLALVAVPHTGAALAGVERLLPLRHRQLRELAQDSESLDRLNIAWQEKNVADMIDIRYVVGGSDRVVSFESCVPFRLDRPPSMLINEDHRSIIDPSSFEDIRYKVIRNFIFPRDEEVSRSGSQPRSTTAFQPDPLFDIYYDYHEPFYLKRDFDVLLSDLIARNTVWITGRPGIGKSASLRRAVIQAGWKLFNINLSAYEKFDPLSLMRGLVGEIASLSDMPPPAADMEMPGLTSALRESLKRLGANQVVGIVVEEIPAHETELRTFAGLVVTMLDFVEGSSQRNDVRFLFSSRATVAELGDPRFAERLQTVRVHDWTDDAISQLISLLTAASSRHITDEDRTHLLSRAQGSPRFVKMVFRKIRNAASAQTMSALCSEVESELVQ